MRSWSVAFAVVLAACTDLGGLSGAGDLPVSDAGGKEARPTPGDDGGGGDAALTCAGGRSACGSACVDVQTDAKNCGRCAHDCLGGECKAGVCAAVTLATGLNDPMGVAQDSNSLYVAVWGANKIVQVAKAAGGKNDVSTLTTSPASIAVALDASGKAAALVWGEWTIGGKAHVVTCTPPCTNVTTVAATGDSVMGLVVSGTRAYFTDSGGATEAIRRCDLPGCTNVNDVVSPLAHAYGLAVTGTTLLYSRHDALGDVGRADASSFGNGTHLFDADTPQGLATDGTNVFAAVSGGNQIAKCPLSGCIGATTTLAFAQNPHAVATDGKNVYWTNGVADGGSVAYCPVSGCPGGAALLAAGQSNPYGIVVDDAAVYWVNSAPMGSVMKIAKP